MDVIPPILASLNAAYAASLTFENQVTLSNQPIQVVEYKTGSVKLIDIVSVRFVGKEGG